MKTLMIALGMTLITSVVLNGNAFTLPPVVVEKVVYEKVAVNEVSIPLTYNADELNAYCKYEAPTYDLCDIYNRSGALYRV